MHKGIDVLQRPRVHLVHAHPAEGSFVAAMRDVLFEEFENLGCLVTLTDLYAEKFNPVLTLEEYSIEPGHHAVIALEQRRCHREGTLPADVQEEIERALAADIIAFTFPVFWFSVPAILKGWIDRILISGLFYGGRRIYGRGGLAGKRAVVAMSMGGRREMFGKDGIHGELVGGMMRHFFQGTLGYVGLSVHEPYVAYHVPYVSDDDRRALLKGLRFYARGIDRVKPLRFPEPDEFDEKLLPRRRL